LAEALLEASGLPRPCRYAVRNCLVEEPPGEALDQHEARCGKRAVSCPEEDCGAELDADDLLRHLTSQHGAEKPGDAEKLSDECLWVLQEEDLSADGGHNANWPISLWRSQVTIPF